MSKYGFYIDMTRCVGCKTCQVACKDKNNLDLDVNYRFVRTFETGVFPNPDIYHYAGTCNHCEDPACVKGCPTGAMYVNSDGIVLHNDDDCIGCHYCTWNCPYGVPQIFESGITGKCDMCQAYIENGAEPVCVNACMMRALKWGTIADLEAEFGADAVKDIAILPDSSLTSPNTYLKIKAACSEPNYVTREV